MSNLIKLEICNSHDNDGRVKNVKHALPYYLSRQGKYFHRVRSAQNHWRDGSYSHTSVHFWCGNSGFEPGLRHRAGTTSFGAGARGDNGGRSWPVMRGLNERYHHSFCCLEIGRHSVVRPGYYLYVPPHSPVDWTALPNLLLFATNHCY